MRIVPRALCYLRVILDSFYIERLQSEVDKSMERMSGQRLDLQAARQELEAKETKLHKLQDQISALLATSEK
eukprot:m.71800 g.71800  ORF g.71800 m.71800 type:complete len:72 (+) comp35761_c0_seq25:629-844(+)